MTTHVLILADGFQRRLPDLVRPKCLLDLPQCAENILGRTLRMVCELAPEAAVLVQGNALVAAALLPKPAGYTSREGVWRRLRGMVDVHNWMGSFRYYRGYPGCSRAIEVLSFDRTPPTVVAALMRCVTFLEEDEACDRVIVLMGDVVYSRNFLVQILTMGGSMAFAGASRINPEVIGMAFDPKALMPLYVEAGIAGTLLAPSTPESLSAEARIRPDDATAIFCDDWTRGINTPFDVRSVLPELDHLARTEEIELQRAEIDRLADPAPLPPNR